MIPPHALQLLEMETGRPAGVMTEAPGESSYVAVWWSNSDMRREAERLHGISGLPRFVFHTKSLLGAHVFYAWTGVGWEPRWIATLSARSRANASLVMAINQAKEAYALYAIGGEDGKLGQIDVFKLQGEAIGQPARLGTQAFRRFADQAVHAHVWVERAGPQASIMQWEESREDWSKFIGHADGGKASLKRGLGGELTFKGNERAHITQTREAGCWAELAGSEMTVDRGLSVMPFYPHGPSTYPHELFISTRMTEAVAVGAEEALRLRDMVGQVVFQDLQGLTSQTLLAQCLQGNLYGTSLHPVTQLESGSLAADRLPELRQQRVNLSVARRQVFEDVAIIIGADPIIMRAIEEMLDGGAEGTQLMGIHQIIPKVGKQAMTCVGKASVPAAERVGVHLQGLHQDTGSKGCIVQIAVDLHKEPLGTWIDPCGCMVGGQPMVSPAMQQVSGSMAVFDLGALHGGAAFTVRQLERAKGLRTHAGEGYLTGRFFIEIGKASMTQAEVSRFQHQYLPCISTTGRAEGAASLPVVRIRSPGLS